jgi:hypothetical protein
LGGSVHIIKKNTERVVACEKTGVEVNADKTRCMFMSRNQNAGGCHNIENKSSSFKKVEEFIYLETHLSN